MRNLLHSLFFFLLVFACKPPEQEPIDIGEVAGNEEVAQYMRSFEGRGALADNSTPTDPETVLSRFDIAADLKMELVLSEPQVNQPLELTFDHRGRMWVVQYNQYPYPKGLKVTNIDNHLRAEFDKIPEPPPQGISGADKITIFEDTNGDGHYDKSTDAISGLNIATGVAFGRGKIWVLNPPYLLAYPDAAGDGIPDGPPVVHLSGFGLEDTHAVANSLRWGPDGWIYGATGSTVTSNISSEATKNVAFEGQGIWRYHPETKIFELFAEGGGNTFHVEIDAKGRIYSGDNGVSRGQYYKQGAYYVKNWGKHGALTNPYAFGYLKNMELEGEPLRFTHAWVKYQGHSLPADYQDKMIAINPLLNYLQLSSITADGSTFKNVDLRRIVETDDHWFRPVDIKVGPDGAVYLADWYDSRLSHVDPNDTWHRNSGRVYRITAKDHSPLAPFDLSEYTNQQLVGLLSHPNKWYRQQAIRLFGDRKDPDNIEPLLELMNGGEPQEALEALWAIHASGGFNDALALNALSHSDPYVRLWGVRLVGDSKVASRSIASQLVSMANTESNPEVLGQLASSAKRLPSDVALPMIEGLVAQPEIELDQDNALLLWWAMESKVEAESASVVALFKDPEIWRYPVVQNFILERLASRLVLPNENMLMDQCASLLKLAPKLSLGKSAFNGTQEGLLGRSLTAVPSSLIEALAPYLEKFGEAPLSIAIRQEQTEAIDSALKIISQESTEVKEQLAYIDLFGELQIQQSIESLLQLMENNSTRTSLRHAALKSLENFDQAQIGKRVADAYPDKLRAEPSLKQAALDLLVSRTSWANHLIHLIDTSKQVKSDDLPTEVVLKMQLLNDQQLTLAINKIWPQLRVQSSQEKEQVMQRIKSVVPAGSIDLSAGESTYSRLCGACHQLFGQGGSLGPDLTGYDRKNLNYLILNIVDPSIDIREGYVNYKLVTTNDRTLSGVLTQRSDQMVTIRSFAGDETSIPADQIKELQAQTISLMPERLIDGLTDQEIVDLFGYIMSE